MGDVAYTWTDITTLSFISILYKTIINSLALGMKNIARASPLGSVASPWAYKTTSLFLFIFHLNYHQCINLSQYLITHNNNLLFFMQVLFDHQCINLGHNFSPCFPKIIINALALIMKNNYKNIPLIVGCFPLGCRKHLLISLHISP